MIQNTRDFIDRVKFWTGGLAILTAGVAGLAITEGMRRRRHYNRPYNPDTFEEITGTIKEISMPKKNNHISKGVILTLDSKEGEIPIHLGPTWFINHQFNRFKRGEKIMVGGSRLRYRGREVLVASSLKRKKKQFRLRDKQGTPYWESKIKT